MRDGLTRVKIGGRAGTVIMVHENGNVNVMLDTGDYELNVTPNRLVEVIEIPKVSVWTKLAFWRRT